jgi:biotin carboxylase
MRPLIVVLPSTEDRRRFSAIGERRGLACRFITRRGGIDTFDARAVLDEIGAIDEPRAIVGLGDYPSVLIAAVAAERAGLPGASPDSVFGASHKYESRLRQRHAIADHVPKFLLWNGRDRPNIAEELGFPCFAKPVKGVASWRCMSIADVAALHDYALQHHLQVPKVVAAFEHLMLIAGLRFESARAILLEEHLYGEQVTVECIADGDSVRALGVVDSHMYSGTRSFRAFSYPSKYPEAVVRRMERIVETALLGSGLRRTLCHAELMYDPASGRIAIIEINPRMSAQFAPLFEMVDGFDMYDLQVQLALGESPTFTRGAGRYPFAASVVFRRFEDGMVVRHPSEEERARVLRHVHGESVECLVDVGERLSQKIQDPESYRYAFVNLGGEDLEDVERRAWMLESAFQFA